MREYDFHVTRLTPFTWDNVNTCSFKRIFLIEFKITWRGALVRSHSRKNVSHNLGKATRTEAIVFIVWVQWVWLKRSINNQDVARGFTPQRCSTWFDFPQLKVVNLERNKFGPSDLTDAGREFHSLEAFRKNELWNNAAGHDRNWTFIPWRRVITWVTEEFRG